MIDDFHEPTLGDYGTALWRRKWILAIGALVGAAVMLVAPIGRGGELNSSVTLEVHDLFSLVQSLQLGLPSVGKPSATAENARALSAASLAQFRQAAGRSASVAGTADESNNQFTLTFTGTTADRTMEDARLFTDLLVKRRTAEQRAELDAAIAVTRAQLESQTAELNRVAERDALSGSPSSQLLTIRNASAASVSRLQERLSGLQEVADLSEAGLTVAADRSPATATPGWGLTKRLALGMVLGLVGAVVVVMILTATDRRLTRRRDVELVCGSTPVLGVIDRAETAGLLASTGRALQQRVEGDGGALRVLAVDSANDSFRLAALLRPFVGDGALTDGGDVLGHLAGDPEQPGEQVMLAANARTTTDDALNAALTVLSDLGVPVLGIVLIDVDPRAMPGAAASIVNEQPAMNGTGHPEVI